MRTLELWNTYTREEVHDIFSPDTVFRPQRGSWGISGIVSIPNRTADWVLFVTYGSRQGAHDFDESITEDGVLTWQSQPSQRLSDPQIRQLIEHDDRLHTIHLFLRSRRGRPYTYCGTLGYLSHDLEREAPVHFQWQLMDWPPPIETLETLGIETSPSTENRYSLTAERTGQLLKTERPLVSPRGGRGTGQFVTRKQVAHPDQDARNSTLGLAGERLVLRHEAEILMSAGRPDLAERIVHVALIEGDSAGYDIKSFEADGSPRFIEVKTTRGPALAAFFVSPNQVEFSSKHANAYVLIRVFDYSDRDDSGRYYEAPGPLIDNFRLEATEFRATLMEGTA
jgi:Domain of unknown function (DUF3883)/Domain of unknown function (DUF3427)